jgi:phage gp29-like protein
MLIRTWHAARAGLARLLATEKSGPALSRPVLPMASLDGLTPERLAGLLKSAVTGYSRDYLELAERMEETDLHYRAVVQTRRLALEGLDVRVVAAADRGAPRVQAQRLEELVRADWFGDLLKLSDGIAKGYAVGELIWDTAGSEWRPAQVLIRPQAWFQFAKADGRTLRLRDGTSNGAELTPYAFVTHIPELKAGLPIRAGLARAAAWSYLFKALALKRWVISAEIFGMPVRLGRYPAGTGEGDIDILFRAVRAIGTDASAVFPDSMQIELKESKGAAGTDIQERLCRYLDSQVSKAVLGQTMTTDDGSSKSQAVVHNEVRLDLLAADARALARTLNTQVVRPWVDLNWGPQAVYPRLELPVEEPEDLAALADALAKLVPVGLPVPARWAAGKWGVPEPAEGEALLGAPAPAVPEGGPLAPQAVRAAHRAGDGQSAPDGIDALVDESLSSWERDLSPLVEPLRAALDALAPEATAAEALALLPGLLAKMDAGPLAERLSKAAYVARLAGRAGIEPEAE